MPTSPRRGSAKAQTQTGTTGRAGAGIIGADQIRAFTAELGLSEESAKDAIADALAEMVNHASPQGSLPGSLASGSGKMFDTAKKFL